MTLATFLRIGLVLQIVAGTLAGAWLLPADLRWLAPVCGLLVPLVGTAIGLAIEFIVGVVVDPRTPPLSLARILAAWWEETVISARVFAIAQPFQAAFAEPPLVRDPARPAVLLIHGYLCNRAVWRTLLDSGTLAHCNVATLNLEPILGPIDRYAAVVHDAVERLRAATGAPQVTIVAHSMGGLATRVYLRDHGDSAVARVITIATPHFGTLFGKFGAGANAQQMAHGSAFFEALARSTAPIADKFVCFASRDDNLIVPRSSPLLPGARQVLFEGVGHLALVEHEPAWHALRDAIGSGTPAIAAAPATALAAGGRPT